MITLTDTAAGKVKELLASEGAYDLALRVSEATSRIHHIPKVLYHWRMVASSSSLDPDVKPYAHDAGKRAVADALTRRGTAGVCEDGPYRTSYRVRYTVRSDP